MGKTITKHTYQKFGNGIGRNKIKLTSHSRQRAMERLNITSSEQLKNMASKARNVGINLDVVNIYNYKDLNIDYNTLISMKRQFRTKNNSNKIYFYKNNMYVFGGNHACTLLTVIPLRQINLD